MKFLHCVSLNYFSVHSHHLLDDSKLDEEPVNLRSPSHTMPASFHHSFKKASVSIDKNTEGGVMKILRNPGINCQHQVILSQCGNFMIFPITQILREIKFGDSRSAKSAILTHLEALNWDFYDFLHFLKA